MSMKNKLSLDYLIVERDILLKQKQWIHKRIRDLNIAIDQLEDDKRNGSRAGTEEKRINRKNHTKDGNRSWDGGRNDR